MTTIPLRGVDKVEILTVLVEPFPQPPDVLRPESLAAPVPGSVADRQ